MQSEIWANITAIQVISRHTRTIVPYDNAIGVYHWYNFENDAFSHLLRLMGVTEQVLD